MEKSQVKIFWVVLAIILLMAISNVTYAQAPNPNIRVYGYLTTWAFKMNMGSSNYENLLYTNMDWDACTDYIMFAAHFDTVGQITTQTTWDGTLSWGALGEDQIQLSKRRFLNDYIHSKGKSIHLCFFCGYDDNWTTLLTTQAGRDAMIKTIVDSIVGPTNRYDGIHFDLEPWNDADTANKRIFFQALHDTLQNYHQWNNVTKKPEVTWAIYGINGHIFCKTMQSYVDAYLHMSYDMFESWFNTTWFNAPLYNTGYTNCPSIDNYTQYWLGYVQKDKLVMGCPFNYNAYQGGSTSGGEGCYAPLLSGLWVGYTNFPTWIDNGSEMYYTAWNRWLDTATTVHIDTIRHAAWVGYNNTGSANDVLVLFQDTSSIRAILEYVSSQGLRGSMVWEIPGAYINSPNQTRHPGLVPDHLLQAVKKTRLNLLTSAASTGNGNLLPTKCLLHQNYPNPFNPSTNISFSISSKSYVSLKVFDLLGREVAAIVSEELPAGNYSRQWNAFNISSGVYFYRLNAGNYMETKKLILLR